jgi:protein phosphatase
VVAENLTPPFDQFTWNLEGLKTDGTVQLQVQSTDMLGLTGTSIEMPVQISVDHPETDPWFVLRRNLLTISILLIIMGLYSWSGCGLLQSSDRSQLPQTRNAGISPKRNETLTHSHPMGGRCSVHTRQPYPMRWRISDVWPKIFCDGAILPITAEDVLFGSDPAHKLADRRGLYRRRACPAETLLKVVGCMTRVRSQALDQSNPVSGGAPNLTLFIWTHRFPFSSGDRACSPTILESPFEASSLKGTKLSDETANDPAERAHLTASAITTLEWSENKMTYSVTAFRTEGERPLPVLFAIVSDGIGGHQAGEIASEMVVETVSQAVAVSSANNPIQTLRESIMRSSQEILVQAESNEEKKGMGATCACALVIGDRLYIAYVGDSRIYLLRNGSIHQISIDHTWVQEAIDAGVIEPDQGKDHPNAHVIRRYLGSKQPVEPDTRLRMSADEGNARSESNQGLPLRPKDQVVLCSDGLTDLVKDEEILAMLQSQEQEKAIEELVKMANQRGGHDNITVVVLRVPETLPDATQPISLPPIPVKKKRPAWVAFLIGVVVLAVIAILLGAAYLFFQGRTSTAASPTPSPVTPAATQPAIVLTPEASPDTLATSSGTPPTPVPTDEPTRLSGQVTPLATFTPWPTNTLTP